MSLVATENRISAHLDPTVLAERAKSVSHLARRIHGWSWQAVSFIRWVPQTIPFSFLFQVPNW
jgi:hypothetical protein